MNKGKVLVDGDVVAYRASSSAQDLSLNDAVEKVDTLMFYILRETTGSPFFNTSDYSVYLTGEGNFRYDIAKSHPYKGNRKDLEKPRYLSVCREYLVTAYNAVLSEGEEADDLISKEAAKLGYNCVVASIDKDMLQLPCWHFNFHHSRDRESSRWSKVEPEEATKNFYTQLLVGDTSDNIKGVHGVGPVKAKKLLQECHTETAMLKVVFGAYNGDEGRVLENGRLLWLRRYEGELWHFPKVD